MRRTLACVLGGLLLAGSSVAAQQPPTPEISIEGVWRVVEQTINDRTLKDGALGVGFHIYTDGYFAAVRESDVPPRKNVIDVDSATAADLLAVWGPFVAQLGTYKMTGDRLSLVTLVSKNPGNMNGREAEQRRIRFEGNTLVVEPVERVPGNRSVTLKMVRVE